MSASACSISLERVIKMGGGQKFNDQTGLSYLQTGCLKLPRKQTEILRNPALQTPFIMLDVEKARDNVSVLKELIPRLEIYYAMKSNPDRRLINAIDNLVDGYDIASLGEFKQLNSMGISADRILYSNPVKVPSHISESYREGVNYYSFDSLEEIAKLSVLAPGSNVYLRLKVSDQGSKFPLSSKFGVPVEKAAVYLKSAKAAGLNPVGLTFHVGSQSESARSWHTAFENCGRLINELKSSGLPLNILDIGGGIPSIYAPDSMPITEVAATINEAIARYIPDDIRIVCEPGRYVSATSGTIVASVIGRGHRGDREWIYLDMGVFQGLMEALEIPSWKYPIWTDYDDEELTEFVLTGPTCDSYDTIGLHYSLPASLKTGDRLYIGTAGAYTTVYQSSFNGFDPPQVYYMDEMGRR